MEVDTTSIRKRQLLEKSDALLVPFFSKQIRIDVGFQGGVATQVMKESTPKKRFGITQFGFQRCNLSNYLRSPAGEEVMNRKSKSGTSLMKLEL